MKTCGYCGAEYDDKEPKCPTCGSTLLKHTKAAVEAEDSYKKIEEEIAKRRKTRSVILAACAGVILILLIALIGSIVGHFNSPEYRMNKQARQTYSQAEKLYKKGEYDDATALLQSINPAWDNYNKVDSLLSDIEDSKDAQELAEHLALLSEYADTGDYEAIIRYVQDNAFDEDEFAAGIGDIYQDALIQYKDSVLAEAESEVAAGNYDAANTLLSNANSLLLEDEEINEKLQEVSSLIAERDRDALLTSLHNDISNGNYEDVLKQLTSYSAYSNDEEFTSAIHEASQGYVSDTIAKADSLIDAGDYSAAQTALEDALLILPEGETDDIDYKIVTVKNLKAIETINVYMDEGNYQEALHYYNTMVTPQTDEDTALKSSIESKYISATKESAQESIDNKDYVSALQTLEGCMADIENAELTVMFDDTLSKYKSETLSAAEAAFNSNGAQAALDVLSGLSAYISDDADIISAREYYNTKFPVALSSLTPYATNGSKIDHTDEEENAFGEMFSDVFYIYYNTGSQTYRLDGQYSRFKAVAFVPRTKHNPGRITISGDGRELFTAELDGGTDNVNIDVSISEVTDLTITLEGYSSFLESTRPSCMAEAVLIP